MFLALQCNATTPSYGHYPEMFYFLIFSLMSDTDDSSFALVGVISVAFHRVSPRLTLNFHIRHV